MTRAAAVSFLNRLRPITASTKRSVPSSSKGVACTISPSSLAIETSLRSMVCRFRAQVQAGEVPPFGQPTLGAPSASLKAQNQPSRRRQSSPMLAR